MATRLTTPIGLVLVTAAVAALAGCDRVGDPIEAIGARRPAPDEFMVLPRKPLMVPDTFAAASLPAPDPGRPSPLLPNPTEQAVAALAGPDATTRPVATASLSAGETALLEAAGTASVSPEIRYQLESDRRAAEEAAAEGPYQPPTLAELFFGDDEEEAEADPETVLDAISESQRLQREGVATPSDPLATAVTEEARGPGVGPGESVEAYYPSTTDRRPANRVTGRDTAPAFE